MQSRYLIFLLPFQQSLQRKREQKGSYKAKLSLEKLIVEYERKKVQVEMIRDKQGKIMKELAELQAVAGETKYAAESEDQCRILEQ